MIMLDWIVVQVLSITQNKIQPYGHCEYTWTKEKQTAKQNHLEQQILNWAAKENSALGNSSVSLARAWFFTTKDC